MVTGHCRECELADHPLTLLQDTSVDSDSGAMKAKHADNPFIEQMQSTTVVDMDGKFLDPPCCRYGRTAVTVPSSFLMYNFLALECVENSSCISVSRPYLVSNPFMSA